MQLVNILTPMQFHIGLVSSCNFCTFLTHIVFLSLVLFLFPRPSIHGNLSHWILWRIFVYFLVAIQKIFWQLQTILSPTKKGMIRDPVEKINLITRVFTQAKLDGSNTLRMMLRSWGKTMLVYHQFCRRSAQTSNRNDHIATSISLPELILINVV